jgi:nitrogen-specific signal transduction histidine kinase
VVVTVRTTARAFRRTLDSTEMFAGRSDAERTQGGLGITLVKRLVQMHGGTINVRSGAPRQRFEVPARGDSAAIG